jgi:hypothetical protein
MFEVLRGFLDMLHIGPEEVLNQMTQSEDAAINAKLEAEKTAIINIFYSEFALTLFEPIFVPPPGTIMRCFVNDEYLFSRRPPCSYYYLYEE